jgi:antitoxin component YwqK of YwqJK toxin-antitoxin module
MTFHDNGRVKEKGNFEKNKKTGEWREYDDRGNITAITIYEKDQVLFTQNPNMVKSYTSYHNNGRIKEQGMLKGTVRNGEWRLYGKRGKLLRKTNYYQGKIVDQNSTRIIDSFVTYHNNGFVKEEGILKMGQRDGIWMMYDDDGDHVETVTYNNGKVLSREKV